ncbi:hypothetical protein [Nonomuraea monospora]|uniref:hypothetical protein n=1 Tax=Nonomuraea monospora TaxID=568818 RepID=UPI0031DC66FB
MHHPADLDVPVPTRDRPAPSTRDRPAALAVTPAGPAIPGVRVEPPRPDHVPEPS